ncbi:MAG: hypothetical protein K940chlam9_00428 [Chlamydiae bacterium]|nr:hypothetical protein [Chlamydiota bacterium]
MSNTPSLTSSTAQTSSKIFDSLNDDDDVKGSVVKGMLQRAHQEGVASVQQLPQQSSPQTEAKCTAKSAAYWIGVAFAVTAAAIGTIGLLTYLGQMNIGLTAVGQMSSTIGLYTMIGGYGAAFLTGILLGVSKCVGGKSQNNQNLNENLLNQIDDA